jgi:hypothetical protein
MGVPIEGLPAGDSPGRLPGVGATADLSVLEPGAGDVSLLTPFEQADRSNGMAQRRVVINRSFMVWPLAEVGSESFDI